MSVGVAVAWVLGAYLLGSISSARLIGHALDPSTDLSITEYPTASGEDAWTYRGVSATSVNAAFGAWWGFLVVGLDVAKGLIPTLVARAIHPDTNLHLSVGLALVVGHLWPVFHRFVGGRGQSTMIGVIVVVGFWSLPIAIVFGVAFGLLVSTSVHMARNGFGLWLWIWFALVDGFGPTVWFGLALAAVYLAAMRPELAEDRRIRGAASSSRPPYSKRLGEAWRDMLSSEP